MTEKLSFKEFAIIVRDSVHNLDLDNPCNKSEFMHALKACIKRQEDFRGYVYPDKAKNPNPSIGWGFNMNATGAKRVWDKKFEGKYDFDKYKESMKLPKKDRPLITEEDAEN